MAALKSLEKVLRMLLVTSSLATNSCGYKKPDYISILQDKSAKIEPNRLSSNCQYLDREDMEQKLAEERASMGWGGIFWGGRHLDTGVDGSIEYKDKHNNSKYLIISKIDSSLNLTPIMKKGNGIGEVFLMADIKAEEDSYNYCLYAFFDKEFFKNNKNIDFESVAIGRDNSLCMPITEKVKFKKIYDGVYTAQLKGKFPYGGSLHIALGTENNPLVAINPPN